MADKSVRVILSATTAGFIAEVRKAEVATKTFQTQLDKTATSAPWQKVSADLGRVGLALTAVAALAVKAWADFDQQMSSVAATGTDAKNSLEELRAAALKAGADTKYSATEAAAGVEALLKAGVSAADVLGGGLAGALSLAASGNLGVADSAEVAATAMVQFGLKGSDVGHIADLLAAGAGKAQGEVSDMAAALKQSGLIASQAGLSIEETTGTLAAFASAGLIGSDAGTSFRTMLLRMMNPTKEAAGLMDQYGISVYDASGKFTTMEGLAGQLQSQLGKLTVEQRNSALATIFGSDAIRGANVLYAQGAAGIDKWTTALNEQGYASDVAKTKMDNLKGDIEQLTGSLDTLAISAGESVGGVLRSMVQQMTELVNIASRNPEAAQGILTLVAALGALALVAAGVMKTVTAMAEFRAASLAMSAASPGAAAAIGGIATAAAKAAVVIALASAAAHALSNDAEMPGVSAGQVALVSLASAADTASESMDRMFQDATAGFGSTDLVYGVDSLNSALSRVANQNIGDDFLGLGASLLGNKTELEMVTAQFDKLDQAMAKVDPETARAAFSKIAESADAQGMSVEKLLTLFPEYKSRLESIAASLGETELTAQDYVDWMGGKVPDAIAVAAAAAKEGKPASDGLKDALSNQALAAKKAADEQRGLADQIKNAADAALSASGSAIAYQGAIDAAAESLKKNGKTLDINTEAGRNNRSALDDVASSALKLADANAKAGETQETVNAGVADGREKFIAAAIQMGATADQAKALADKYGLIPGTVLTTITTKTDDGLTRYQQALASLKDKTVTITTLNEVLVYQNGKYAAKVQANADGGAISGPGTGTSDSILSWLSNGEFVVNAAATAANRNLLEAINSGYRMPGFRDGGAVMAAPSPSYSSSVTVAPSNVGVSVYLDGADMTHRARVVYSQESAALATAQRRNSK